MRALLLQVVLLAASGKETDASRCQRAINTPLRQQGDLFVVSACAPLFRPRCQGALGRARKDRTIREALAIVDQCASEYCPGLPDQKLCQPDHDRSAQGVRLAFQPFIEAALAGTPGISPGDLDVVGLAIATELIVAETVHLRVSTDGGQLVLSLPGASWRTKDPPAPADLAPLRATLRKLLPDRRNGAVIIEGANAVSKAARRAIQDAIAQEEYEFVTH